MPTLTASTNYARELNRGAQTCETAMRKAQQEQSEQSQRLLACIGKELEFNVRGGSNRRVPVPQRQPVLDGHDEEEPRAGSSIGAGLLLDDGMEFTAIVIKAGINNRGRSYLMVAVGATQEAVNSRGSELLHPGKEYQLFLDRITVVGGLD